MFKLKQPNLLCGAKSSRFKLGKIRGGSNLSRLDDRCATLALDRIHQFRREQGQRCVDNGPRDSQIDLDQCVYDDFTDKDGGNQTATGLLASSSTAEQPAQSSKEAPKKPPKPSKESHKKPPKPKPLKPKPSPASVASPTDASPTPPSQPAPNAYDPNECPYAVLDTESLSKPATKPQPAEVSKPSPLPSTQEQPEPQQPEPSEAVDSDRAAVDEVERQEPVYADIIGVLRQ